MDRCDQTRTRLQPCRPTMPHIDQPFRRRCLAFAAALALIGAATALPAAAADRIRLVAQRTGSLAWELDVIKAHGLDRKANLDIETLELASTEAGKVALMGGSADVIVSDWTWVARERALGDGLVYYPYLSTLGAVMAPAN